MAGPLPFAGLWQARGRRLEDVWFRYHRRGPRVLRAAQARTEPGEVAVVLDRNGVGRFHAAARDLVPALVDEVGGVATLVLGLSGSVAPWLVPPVMATARGADRPAGHLDGAPAQRGGAGLGRGGSGRPGPATSRPPLSGPDSSRRRPCGGPPACRVRSWGGRCRAPPRLS
ncbi:hypothetical protein [Micromonospora sp. NPDC050200]|uniref:hypothetical protein n=1 Tax=Micromonospora sp. NPDC050200 TaxID=3155664 RepID=UPI0033CE0C17